MNDNDRLRLYVLAHSRDQKIWKTFVYIRKDIRSKYHIPTTPDGIWPAEILYALCILFSLEKTELDRFMSAAEIEKYEVLKTSAEESLRSSAKWDTFPFYEMRKLLEKDFNYINRTVGTFRTTDQTDKTVDIDQTDFFSKLENETISAADISEYSVILKLTYMAGGIFFKTLGIRSLIEHYRTKSAESAAPKKSLDDILSMKKNLRNQLMKDVRGQDTAVEKFVDGYIRYRLRGKLLGKPAGIFLFAGPPGTGKTYLAEKFVELMADEGYRYKRFDMAAYGSSNSDNITGLVGFERSWRRSEPGLLTGFVKEHPKCVLLFDEIEKACPGVRLLFLSVLEGAVLTDKYYDEQVSFEDAILVFTTNEGKDLYEDNRGANLTALPDSAVMEGLQAPPSQFPPELISRFMSGTIVMFNHLNYFDLSAIFKNSVDKTVQQIRESNDLHIGFRYSWEKLARLYLLGKGSNIDARFVSSNTKKTVENYFLEAMEFIREECFRSLKELRVVSVSVEPSGEFRKYFEMRYRPRILGYINRSAEVYAGEIPQRYGRSLPQRGLKKLQQRADCVWAETGESFKEFLLNCNWNSEKRKDRFDAVLIDLAGGPGDEDTAEGYACLKSAAEENLDIPIIVVSRGEAAKKKTQASLAEQGATDFVRGIWCDPQETVKNDPDIHRCEDREEKILALDWKELKNIFDRQHFVRMAAELVRKGERLSSEVTYRYKKESGELEICFGGLCAKPATVESAASRRLDKKYLLVDRPRVSFEEIYGNKEAKEEVKRCIDNIRHPERYTKLMTGILLYGKPGMGKTMFGKAMAYESHAAFISVVGSDFLNGNGVSKMEEIFQTARRRARRDKACILFIDEFDAISKDRGGRLEHYQEIVLEKFLKEMDGLETDNHGVYVVGATNYPLENLDRAVTRRFSVRIPFPYPVMEERFTYLKNILNKNKQTKHISDSDIKTLNRMMLTFGDRIRSYAEIGTFIEESIAAAIHLHKTVDMRFLLERINRMAGPARQENDPEKYLSTAFHEAGHAVLQNYFGLEVDYVTIVSRGMYGGYSSAWPKYHTGQDFLNQICTFLAGRVAEMIYLANSGEDYRQGVNTGAENDLQKAARIACDYVCRYGLDERFIAIPGIFTLQSGAFPESIMPESEKEAVWTSVKEILAQQQKRARRLLSERWSEVFALAISLFSMKELDHKTVTEIIERKLPYVEESCFLDSDDDYVTATWTASESEEILLGYPVYPFTRMSIPSEKTNLTGADGRHYYYAVKTAREGLHIHEKLQDAFDEAFVNQAYCRRFKTRKAAQEYLEMLEVTALRQNGEYFLGVRADAFAEMTDSNIPVKYLMDLKGEKLEQWQKTAAEEGKPLARRVIEEAEMFLETFENVHMVIRIYGKTLRDEFLRCLDAREKEGSDGTGIAEI